MVSEVKSLSCVQLLVTPWTLAHQAPLSMKLPRQEDWSGLPFPSPGDLPNPRIGLVSPALASGFFITSTTWEALFLTSGGGGFVAKLCPTLATPWTVACQAPVSMGFSRQHYWSGLPFPSPGDLPKLGIKPRSPALQAHSLLPEPPGKPLYTTHVRKL